jgi:BON domain-containing protein
MRRFLALFLLPFLALAAMSAAPAYAASSPGKTTSSGQPRPVIGDAQLESTIRTKLSKSKIGKDGFRFHVARGVVTWEGTTAIGQHKGAATRMARTSGAAQVINNIRVSGAGKETPLRKAYVQP